MSTYREIVGKKIKKVSSDPSDGLDGEMWYNSTTGKLKGLAAVSAWSSGANMSNAKSYRFGGGTQTAAFAAGGSPFPIVSTEEYNGSGWSAGGDIGSARYEGGSAGTQTAGLIYGGYDTTAENKTEEYDGSAWTAQNVLNTAGYSQGGFGIQTAAVYTNRNDTALTADTEEYNGTSWSEGNNSSTSRGDVGTAGILTAGMIFGGGTPPPAVIAETELYDGTNWTTGPSMNNARSQLGGSGIQTSALAFGGRYTPPGSVLRDYTESFDGTSWSETSDLATARRQISSTRTEAGNSQALCIGGKSPSVTAATEEWNSSTSVYTAAAWAAGGALNTGRMNVSMGGTQTAGIVLGGHTSPGAEPKAVETYNGSAFSSATAIGPYSGDYAAYAGSSTAGIIFGGAPYTTSTAEYNGSWTGGGALSTGRSQLMGAGTGETSAVAIGGFTDSTTTTTATEEYGGSSWTAGGSMSTQRGRGAGFGIETAALVVGGSTSPDTTLTANSEEYGGTSWTSGGSLFAATSSFLGGWGTQTDGAIVGGGTPGYVNTTLGYDGTSWSTRPNAAYAAGRTQTAGADGSAGLRAGGGPNTSQRDGSEEFTGETSAANIKSFTTS